MLEAGGWMLGSGCWVLDGGTALAGLDKRILDKWILDKRIRG